MEAENLERKKRQGKREKEKKGPNIDFADELNDRKAKVLLVNGREIEGVIKTGQFFISVKNNEGVEYVNKRFIVSIIVPR